MHQLPQTSNYLSPKQNMGETSRCRGQQTTQQMATANTQEVLGDDNCLEWPHGWCDASLV